MDALFVFLAALGDQTTTALQPYELAMRNAWARYLSGVAQNKLYVWAMNILNFDTLSVSGKAITFLDELSLMNLIVSPQTIWNVVYNLFDWPTWFNFAVLYINNWGTWTTAGYNLLVSKITYPISDFGIKLVRFSNDVKAAQQICGPISNSVCTGSNIFQYNIIGANGLLGIGTTFKSCDALLSPNGHYFLALQSDGNVVIWDYYTPTTVVWSTNSATTATAGQNYVLSYQSDGNLVLYTSSSLPRKVLWSSSTVNVVPGTLAMQDDGNLVIYIGSVSIWNTNTNKGVAAVSCATFFNVGSYMVKSQVLTPCQALFSLDGGHMLIMQLDGNLVLYNTKESPSKVTWKTNTIFPSWQGYYTTLNFEANGNLVLFANFALKWSTGTNGKDSTTLVLQNDGNLVMYKAAGAIDSGTVVWATNTGVPIAASTGIVTATNHNSRRIS